MAAAAQVVLQVAGAGAGPVPTDDRLQDVDGRVEPAAHRQRRGQVGGGQRVRFAAGG